MKGITLLCLCLPALALVSCSESAVHKKLSSCDSLVIQFNAPNSEMITQTFQATDHNAINKMAGFIDGAVTTEFKCGSDGSLIFFTSGKATQPVLFKFRDKDCRHFLFEWEGKTRSTKMTQEAADFLESLEKGKSWNN